MDNTYHKSKNAGCELADTVLAFKLLHAYNLMEMEVKLVLTGVVYKIGKETKNMLTQTKGTLKKFLGRSIVSMNEQHKGQCSRRYCVDHW